MSREVERRTFAGGFEVQEEAREGAKKKKLKGYAARFDSMSEDLGGFREIIKPGAFDRALEEKHDVRALVNHDSNLILGRSTAGTLKLSVDKNGLLAEIDPPDTQAGRDAVVSVERGDFTGMSFAFRTLTDEWRHQDGEVVRELLDLELFDVSVVAYPAYPATQVSARALDRAKSEQAPPPPEVVPPDHAGLLAVIEMGKKLAAL